MTTCEDCCDQYYLAPLSRLHEDRPLSCPVLLESLLVPVCQQSWRLRGTIALLHRFCLSVFRARRLLQTYSSQNSGESWPISLRVPAHNQAVEDINSRNKVYAAALLSQFILNAVQALKWHII
ncbi:unnamed protein product [Protopolystoma xenopodis]|uniref:Uncharacterized protein n=1 Tax=Protopolystoma xenopodis TaxID=117903 RepID=A0A3S5FEW6_9PLAT|nr:unnamed protein product [Protopolystoma xenopodis]